MSPFIYFLSSFPICFLPITHSFVFFHCHENLISLGRIALNLLANSVGNNIIEYMN